MDSSLIKYANEFLIINTVITMGFRCALNYRKSDGWKKVPSFKSVIILLITFDVYILFSVFRTIDKGIGGVDSLTYRTHFLNADRKLLSYLSYSKEEPGFMLILWIFRKFTDNYKYPLFFFHSVAFIVLAIFFFKVEENKRDIFGWLYTFLICSYLLYMMNILRSGFVIILATMFFYELINRKYKKCLVLLLIMSTIHISSIVLIIPFLYLWLKDNYIRLNNTLLWVGMACTIECLILVIIRSRIVNSVYGSYKAEGIAIRSYAVIAVVLFLMYLQNTKTHEIGFYREMVVLSFSFCCIPIQSEYTIAYRMLILFFPLLYLCMYQLLIKNKILGVFKFRIRSFFVRGIVIIYFIYRAYTTFYVEFEHIYPYTNDLVPFL